MEIEGIHIYLIRKSIRCMHLRVKPDGQVQVTAPWLMPECTIYDFVQSKWSWVQSSRERVLQHPPKPLPVVTKAQTQALIDYLTFRVEYWRQQMGEAPISWKIRNMKSQWGNCRAQLRLITFNLQLALVPDSLRDYIIVHELSHLQVQNHGPLFKARMTQFMPDWSERKRQLKEYLLQLNTSND